MKHINETNKKTFVSIILLNEILNNNTQFKIVQDSAANGFLEPLFIELMSKGYLTTSGMFYTVTNKGEESFNNFMKRYNEYLKVYDIFSFVDLEKGEFAFSSYFDFDTDEAWNSFKMDPRFHDMRIAVAKFKKLDPAEIVFMQFIAENRFDTTSTGWQMDVISDAIWDEIEKICETAVTAEQAGGEDAMVDMIKQGSVLMVNLLKEEESRRKQQLLEQQNNQVYSGNSEEVITETVTETVEEEDIVYYEHYYDPFYISPIWVAAIILW